MAKNRENTFGDVCRVFAAGILLPMMAIGAEGVKSDATFVFLQPETWSFWRTATNSTMTIPVYHPKGAMKADLLVEGMQYSKAYYGITAQSVDIELPAPTNERTENVYTLTLSFDDGTVQTAKLGAVRGYAKDAAGVARCVIPEESASWKKFKYRAVLPVPYGMPYALSLVGGGDGFFFIMK